jgi:hypothetical protein
MHMSIRSDINAIGTGAATARPGAAFMPAALILGGLLLLIRP